MHSLLMPFSLLKQKMYCNINNIVYRNEFTLNNSVKPTIDVECTKILTAYELKKYKIKYKMKLKYFLKKGCQIYLAVFHGEVVGYSIVCNLKNFKPYLYNESSIFRGPSSHYIFNCHTLPAFRGNNIFPYMLLEIAHDYRSEQTALYISTNVNNLSSQKGIEKSNFIRVGTIKYKRFLFLSSFQTRISN